MHVCVVKRKFCEVPLKPQLFDVFWNKKIKKNTNNKKIIIFFFSFQLMNNCRVEKCFVHASICMYVYAYVCACVCVCFFFTPCCFIWNLILRKTFNGSFVHWIMCFFFLFLLSINYTLKVSFYSSVRGIASSFFFLSFYSHTSIIYGNLVFGILKRFFCFFAFMFFFFFFLFLFLAFVF